MPRSERRKETVVAGAATVYTLFLFEAAGMAPRPDNPTKLRPEDIAHVIASMLALDDRGFVTDATVWATNPRW